MMFYEISRFQISKWATKQHLEFAVFAFDLEVLVPNKTLETIGSKIFTWFW